MTPRKIRAQIVLEKIAWIHKQWIKPLVSLMLGGVAGIADYQCTQMLGSNYHRLAPVFPSDVSIPMDGVKKIPDMIEYAKSLDLGPTIEWMRDHWV